MQESHDEWSSVVTRDPWFKGHEATLTLTNSSNAIVTKEPPPYGHRKGYVPRIQEDFGDGGAFPEIFSAQYPLGPIFKCYFHHKLTASFFRYGDG